MPVVSGISSPVSIGPVSIWTRRCAAARGMASCQAELQARGPAGSSCVMWSARCVSRVKLTGSVQLGAQLEQRLGLPVTDPPGDDEDHRQPALRTRVVDQDAPAVPRAGDPEALADNAPDGSRLLVINAALRDLVERRREIADRGCPRTPGEA